jgi:hypothetical protein
MGAYGTVTPNHDDLNDQYYGLKGFVSTEPAFEGYGINYGVHGYAHRGLVNHGVYGHVTGFDSGTINYGVYGAAGGIGTRYAGYFVGNTHVNGTFTASTKTFKIDHPLDPLNKNLLHSCVESPDMMNIYNGNVVTNDNGLANVKLPNYFEALNKDFRYQLTVIGEFAQAIISEEINNNHFSIKTDKPNIKVSWQVTGIRQDAFANAHRILVEEDKPAHERGKYLHPEVFGKSRELGVDYHPEHETERRRMEEEHKLNESRSQEETTMKKIEIGSF